ncbi:MAG: hypothetical protein U0871_16255 [Gemmataceae bacterium]
MSLLLIPAVLLSAIAMTALAYLFAVQLGVLQPGTVEPFAPGSADPSADTLAGYSEVVQTVLDVNRVEWQVATLHSLSDVEDLLDSLENHGVTERDVTALSNDTFAVRWR